MKATLEFSLPDDEDDFEVASHARDWQLTVCEIDRYLHDRLKYGKMSKAARTALEDVQAELHEALEERNLAL